MTRDQIKIVSTEALWARLDVLDGEVWFASVQPERARILDEITRRESARCGVLVPAEPSVS